MEKQCELFLSDFNMAKTESYRASWFSRMEEVLCPFKVLYLFENSVDLALRPYLHRNWVHLSILDSFCDELDAIETKPTAYISALIRAAQNPTSRELDDRVRRIEQELPDVVNERWKTEHILGPSVSQFPSPELWDEFKRQLTSLSTRDYEWIMRSTNREASPNLWTTLFFHPEDWPLLVEEGLIREAEYKELFDSPIRRIFTMSPNPLPILAGGWGVSGSLHSVPLIGVLRVVLNVAETVGIHRVSTDEGFDGVWFHRTIEAVKTAEVEELLRRATRLPSLPSVWVAACLRLSLDAPSLDATILLDFWERHENAKPRFIGFTGDRLSQEYSTLVGKILDDDRDCALRLAAAITMEGQPDAKVQNRLRDRLAALLPGSPKNSYIADVGFRTLLNLEPSSDELVIWEQLEKSAWRHRSPLWHLRELRSRFDKVATWGVSGDRHRRDQLRQRFSPFIVQRRQYSSEIARAALEAMLQLDGADIPPLEDSDWRMGST